MYKAMIKKSKNKKGFTLVELIVVMAILAILAAILIPSVSGMIERSNKTVDNATGRSLYMAASMAYAIDNTVRGLVGGDDPDLTKATGVVATNSSEGVQAFIDYTGFAAGSTVPVKSTGEGNWYVAVDTNGNVTVTLGGQEWSVTSGAVEWSN